MNELITANLDNTVARIETYFAQRGIDENNLRYELYYSPAVRCPVKELERQTLTTSNLTDVVNETLAHLSASDLDIDEAIFIAGVSRPPLGSLAHISFVARTHEGDNKYYILCLFDKADEEKETKK